MFLKLWAMHCFQPMNLFGLVCKILEEISCSLHSMSNIGEATFLIKRCKLHQFDVISMFCCSLYCVCDALKSISLTVSFVSVWGTHTADSNTPKARLSMIMIFGAGDLQLHRGVAGD